MRLSACPAYIPVPKASPLPGMKTRLEETPAAEKVTFSKALGVAGERLLDFSYTASALPKFIYPTVTGTPEQQALTWQALDSLPMHQAVRPISVEAQASFSQGPNYLGLNRIAIGRITLNSSGYGMNIPSEFKEVVIHEVGHSVDYKSGISTMVTRTQPSAGHPFGKPDFVSDYAATQPAEDFAETYRVHHTRPEQLEAVNPEKAAVMRKLDQPGWLEKLVDRPAYRETGKFVARQFESVPLARSGLELLRQVSVVNLAVSGASDTIQGITQSDWTRATRGMLNTGAGIGLAMAPHAPWLGVAATAALGGQRGLQLASDEGASAARKTTAVLAGAAGGTVGGFVAPLALVQAGYSAAGPIGGTVGLVVGGLLGSYLGSTLAAKAALSLTEE